MERIVLRHISGSKANEVQEFPLNHIRELVLGRDPSATVRYDPDRDDLVGRQHARIAQDAADPTQFSITDLNSRNGTFVNKQRVVGSARLGPGDRVQLGPGGPELEFDLDPRPPNSLRPTRGVNFDALPPTVHGTATAVPQTRSVGLDAPSSVITSPAAPAGGVGKATVERMISQNIAITKRSEGRKYMLVGGAALAGVLVLFLAVAGFLFYRSRTTESQIGAVKEEVTKTAASAPLSSAEIAKANRNSVVQIEVTWKLISPKGDLVYHRADCPDGYCYLLLADGKTIEPWLVYNESLSRGRKPIGDEFSASGVVTSNDGYILTSHHVAAAWETPYNLVENSGGGYGSLFDIRDGKYLRRVSIKDEQNFEWIPSETQQDIFQDKNRKIKLGKFNGTNDRLNVFFPGATESNNARQVKASEVYDIAMIKVDLPSGLPKAEPYDGLDSVKQGDEIFVIGYPFSSLSASGRKREIPEPSISAGNIGKLVRTQEASARKQQVTSKIGDAYQLTVNSADEGYDGAPVFDNRGRVIGIFNVNKNLLGVPITVAVPMRYGIELMSVGTTK